MNYEKEKKLIISSSIDTKIEIDDSKNTAE